MSFVKEMNDYRKQYGSSAFKGGLVFGANCLSYLLHLQPFVGPMYLGWDITFRCNAKCGFCDRWKHPLPKEELTTAQCKAVIDDLAKLKTWNISFGGGEPLLRDDLFELVGYARKKGILVNINTNGYLLSERLVEIFNSGVSSITVSVDSESEAYHDSQRRISGLFAKAVSAIKEIRRVRAFKKPELQVRAVITKDNQLNLMRYYEFWKDKVDSVVFQPVHGDGGAMFKTNTEVDSEALKKMMNQLSFAKSQFGNDYYKRFPQFYSDPGLMRKQFKCFAGYFTAQIDHVGDVFACTAYKYKLGSLKRNSFKEIWNGVQARIRRSTLRNRENKCFCWYNCNGTLNCYLNKVL
jgi:MoaA/NifB/PqqE/SkfB family radical SAM enzyme